MQLITFLLSAQETALIITGVPVLLAVILVVLKTYWRERQADYEQAIISLPLSFKKHPSLNLNAHKASIQGLSWVISMGIMVIVFSCSTPMPPKGEEETVDVLERIEIGSNEKMESPPIDLKTETEETPKKESPAVENKKNIPPPPPPPPPPSLSDIPDDEFMDDYYEEDPEVVEIVEEVIEDEEPIFTIVEEMPRFPGCEQLEGDPKEKKACADEKLLAFIKGNLKYPEAARSNGVEGHCVIGFVVDTEGKIEVLEVLRDPGWGTKEESLRVMELIKDLPAWTPGKQGGIPVKVRWNLPIRFSLKIN